MVNTQIQIPREKSIEFGSGYVLTHAPYLGTLSVKRGRGEHISIIAPAGDDIDHINLLTDITTAVRNASKRGYLASMILGPHGEGSAAAAMSGALCFMPCHWAAYGAAITKFTPLAAYFAKPRSCCHVPDPSIAEQLTAFGIDAVFYGTIAGLFIGAIRRIARRRKTGSLLESLESCIDKIAGDSEEKRFSIFEEQEYSQIEATAKSHGLAELLSERAKQDYARPSETKLGKVVRPIVSGLARAARMVSNRKYQETGKALSHAYQSLGKKTREVALERKDGVKTMLELVAKRYDSESVTYQNPFNPKGLAKKLSNFATGFTQNHNLYRI